MENPLFVCDLSGMRRVNVLEKEKEREKRKRNKRDRQKRRMIDDLNKKSHTVERISILVTRKKKHCYKMTASIQHNLLLNSFFLLLSYFEDIHGNNSYFFLSYIIYAKFKRFDKKYFI